MARSRFHEHKATLDGREVKYLLADQQRVQLGTGLKMRQVTRLTETGHQTPDLTTRRDRLPRRVPVRAVTAGEVVKLAAERKHLTDLLKMVAYQVESELARQIAPHYRRAEDEGRSLIRSALASAADIEVSADEIHVRLAPLSAPRLTRAVAALCEELNLARAVFPGTWQRLRYSVEAADAG